MRSGMHDKIQAALALALEFGGIDGDHHQKWLVDQMVRALADNYDEWVRSYELPDSDDPEDYCEWDTGIAP